VLALNSLFFIKKCLNYLISILSHKNFGLEFNIFTSNIAFIFASDSLSLLYDSLLYICKSVFIPFASNPSQCAIKIALGR
jgi:hypothetical protein